MPNRSIAPETTPITQLNFIPSTGIALPCGVVVYCSPKRALGVLRFDMFWLHKNSTQNKPGQAKAATQLLFSGTNTKTAEVVLDGFESLGANFFCDAGLLSSSITIKSIKSQFFKVLPILSDVLENSIYPQSELDLYKKSETSSLLRKMQTPGYWSQRLCLEAVYGEKSPDTSFSTPNDIEALSQSDLLSYTRKHIQTKQAVLFVSGDYDDVILNHINDAFSSFSTDKQELTKPEHNKDKREPKTIKHPISHSNQVSLCMAKNIDRVAYTEFPKLSLLNLFLGGFFGSRLMQELREERGLTYGIGSSISLSTLGHIWMIKGEMNSQNANLTQDCIRDILNKLTTEPPVGEELEKAKRYFGGQLRGSLDGPFSEPSRIQFLMKTEYPQQYYEEAMQTIWSTNTNTIAELAYNYLNPDSFTIALAGEM
jgi:predicted Zn-dependent peptidase